MTPQALAHDALVYSSDEEFVAAAAPFLAEGRKKGERAVAVTTPRNVALLREALGDVSSQVRFVDAATWYERPGSTIEGYRRVLAEDAGTPARVIGEVDFGGSPWEQRAWTRYEAVLNRVFADQPAWVVCPYDRRTLPAEVIEHAARTHPHIRHGTDRAPSRHYEGAEFALRLPEPAMDSPPILATTVRLPWGLPAARRELEAALAGAPLAEQTRLGGVFAIHEVLANAVEHGAGEAALALWQAPDRVVCEVSEAGAGPSDPLGTLLAPDDATVEGGLGLWLVHQLCEAVEFTATDSGNRLRLSFATNDSPGSS